MSSSSDHSGAPPKRKKRVNRTMRSRNMGKDDEFGKMITGEKGLPIDMLQEIMTHLAPRELEVPKRESTLRRSGRNVAPALKVMRGVDKSFKEAADRVINESKTGDPIASAMKRSREKRERDRKNDPHTTVEQAMKKSRIGDLLGKGRTDVIVVPYDAATGDIDIFTRYPSPSPDDSGIPRMRTHRLQDGAKNKIAGLGRTFGGQRDLLDPASAMYRDDGPPRGSAFKVAHQRSARRSPRRAVGSRVQVWHGTAHHTSGGLTKAGLIRKNGRLVSRKASAASRRRR